jgi:DNA-binding transcriptional regulator YiaG
MSELKIEISRLARKEIKKELEPIKRVNAAQRGYIADLRREVADLQKEVNRLRRELVKAAPEVEQEEPDTRFWITGKGVASLRSRLGLTQAEFGKLAGVTTQSIVKWEKSEGKIPFRQQQTALNVQTIRGMGKREARAALEENQG